MVADIFKSVFKNFQSFLVIWAVVIIVNQLFIFGGCFAPYCLLAALPHTSIISALILYFSNKAENETSNGSANSTKYETTSSSSNTYSTNIIEDSEDNDIEDVQEPYCPKCKSKMVLRTAKKGRYEGRKFWGCSQYPKCDAIINM